MNRQEGGKDVGRAGGWGWGSLWARLRKGGWGFIYLLSDICRIRYARLGLGGGRKSGQEGLYTLWNFVL